jgi:hypothetical protein
MKDKKVKYVEMEKDENDRYVRDDSGKIKSTGKTEKIDNPVYLKANRPKFCKRKTDLCPTVKCWEADCPFLMLSAPVQKDEEVALRAVDKYYKELEKKNRKKKKKA